MCTIATFAKINYLEIYNASEGFIAGQQTPNDDGLLLFTEHGIFYEFMPVEEYGVPVLHYYTLGRPVLIADVVKQLV